MSLVADGNGLRRQRLQLDAEPIHERADLRRQGSLYAWPDVDLRSLPLQGRDELLSVLYGDRRAVLRLEHVCRRLVWAEGKRQRVHERQRVQLAVLCRRILLQRQVRRVMSGVRSGRVAQRRVLDGRERAATRHATGLQRVRGSE